jgi:hypothetical protein
VKFNFNNQFFSSTIDQNKPFIFMVESFAPQPLSLPPEKRDNNSLTKKIWRRKMLRQVSAVALH